MTRRQTTIAESPKTGDAAHQDQAPHGFAVNRKPSGTKGNASLGIAMMEPSRFVIGVVIALTAAAPVGGCGRDVAQPGSPEAEIVRLSRDMGEHEAEVARIELRVEALEARSQAMEMDHGMGGGMAMDHGMGGAAPMGTAPPTAAPMGTAPPTAAPMGAAPTAAPMGTAPPTAAPMGTAPPTAAPMGSGGGMRRMGGMGTGGMEGM